jgi:ABC-2 type transport system permease protein
MNKTWIVARYEMATTLRKKSYLIMAFGVPLLALMVFLAAWLLRDGQPEIEASPSATERDQPLEIEGYVDRSGLIEALPADLKDLLVAYPDETAARQALAAGDIAAYYVVPASYVETGALRYVNPEYSWAAGHDQSWLMERVLFVNLLGNDPGRVARATEPMDLVLEPLKPGEVSAAADVPFYLPYGAMMAFAVVLLAAAGLLLGSLGDEKKNRVMELLLTSVHPRHLLAGKVTGLGLLGLLQAVAWLGTAYVLLRLGGQAMGLKALASLSPAILAWGVVLFLLGYGVYGSLLAGLGALSPGPEEAGQAFIVVIWPLLVPMFLFVALIEQPHGTLATALSLFPPTAPVAMLTRLVSAAAAGAPVAAWQPALASILLALTAGVTLRAVARLFQAKHLLSGQPFSIRRYLRALR